eukprot:3518140-Rhodomonas_salina.1
MSSLWELGFPPSTSVLPHIIVVGITFYWFLATFAAASTNARRKREDEGGNRELHISMSPSETMPEKFNIFLMCRKLRVHQVPDLVHLIGPEQLRVQCSAELRKGGYQFPLSTRKMYRNGDSVLPGSEDASSANEQNAKTRGDFQVEISGAKASARDCEMECEVGTPVSPASAMQYPQLTPAMPFPGRRAGAAVFEGPVQRVVQSSEHCERVARPAVHPQETPSQEPALAVAQA